MVEELRYERAAEINQLVELGYTEAEVAINTVTTSIRFVKGDAVVTLEQDSRLRVTWWTTDGCVMSFGVLLKLVQRDEICGDQRGGPVCQAMSFLTFGHNGHRGQSSLIIRQGDRQNTQTRLY
jgi:hypothetical protein